MSESGEGDRINLVRASIEKRLTTTRQRRPGRDHIIDKNDMSRDSTGCTERIGHVLRSSFGVEADLVGRITISDQSINHR